MDTKTQEAEIERLTDMVLRREKTILELRKEIRELKEKNQNQTIWVHEAWDERNAAVALIDAADEEKKRLNKQLKEAHLVRDALIRIVAQLQQEDPS